jgi:hypothetical protein
LETNTHFIRHTHSPKQLVILEVNKTTIGYQIINAMSAIKMLLANNPYLSVARNLFQKLFSYSTFLQSISCRIISGLYTFFFPLKKA